MQYREKSINEMYIVSPLWSHYLEHWWPTVWRTTKTISNIISTQILIFSLKKSTSECIVFDVIFILLSEEVASKTWWRHQMETLSAFLALCEGNSPVTGGFPSQRPAKRGFDVFFDLRMNIRLSKQSRRRWFETPSRSYWRHCNVFRIRFR